MSNPPYIDPSDLKSLPVSVARFEDHRALFAEDRGLACIARILLLATRLVKASNMIGDGDNAIPSVQEPNLVVEFGGDSQVDSIRALLKAKQDVGELRWFQIHQDYAGHARWFSCRVNPSLL